MNGCETSSICLYAVGHDPQGTWASHFEKINEAIVSLTLVKDRQIAFTPKTTPKTIGEAEKFGWQVHIEDNPVGRARFMGVRRIAEAATTHGNLWDGDRLIHALELKGGHDELRDFTEAVVKHDFLLAGATPEAIATHQSSMTVWEGVKSWLLGRYIGIEGDIANRGCFGFSKELAEFVGSHLATEGDDADGLIPLLAVAFREQIRRGKINPTNYIPIGYREYNIMTRYEDWVFEGRPSEESACAKNTYYDFYRRMESVLKIFMNAQDVSEKYKLGLVEGESIREMLKRVVNT